MRNIGVALKIGQLISRMKFLIVGCLFCLPFAGISQNYSMCPANGSKNISADMHFKLVFSATPVLQRAGNINLFKSDGTLVETIDLSKLPSGTPNTATWPWTETLNGSSVKVIKVVIEKNTAIICFANKAMNYDNGYYITADENIFSNSAAIGFKGIAVNEWSFTTRSKPVADFNYDLADDGTGDFATLQGVLDFIPSGNSTKTKIFIKNGIYIGLISSTGKNNITIEGENVDSVIIKAYNNNNLNNTGSSYRCMANISGSDLTFVNLTFINSTPNGGSQAETLKLSGDRNVIANCKFYSYQDTVLLSGKIYLKDCIIEGAVDFIWGSGSVFFQSCEIRANDNGYNVQARNDNGVRGYVFADCDITSTSSSISSHYLGRDAGTKYIYSEIVYLNCMLGSHIASAGWNSGRLTDASKILFAEYQSVNLTGELINTASRDKNSKQLTEAQNTQYRDLKWFFSGWMPVLPSYKTTKKPTVIITSPSKSTSIPYTDSLSINVFAKDPDGIISSVEIYADSILLHTSTSSPYTYTWSGFSVGKHVITAIATDSSGLKTTSAPIVLTVTIPVSRVEVSPDSVSLLVGEYFELSATVLPSDASNTYVTWSSGNKAIATVGSSTGKVKGVSVGTVAITASSRDGNKTDSCIVYVKQATSVEILQNPSKQGLIIYPNPAESMLNINFNNELTNNVNIEIIDITGKIVKKIQTDDLSNNLDVSNLPSGLYAVQVSDLKLTKSVIIKNDY